MLRPLAGRGRLRLVARNSTRRSGPIGDFSNSKLVSVPVCSRFEPSRVGNVLSATGFAILSLSSRTDSGPNIVWLVLASRLISRLYDKHTLSAEGGWPVLCANSVAESGISNSSPKDLISCSVVRLPDKAFPSSSREINVLSLLTTPTPRPSGYVVKRKAANSKASAKPSASGCPFGNRPRTPRLSASTVGFVETAFLSKPVVTIAGRWGRLIVAVGNNSLLCAKVLGSTSVVASAAREAWLK